MPQLTIYHNPRCSKSRQSLALLQEHNCSIRIVKYLETPLNAQQLEIIHRQLQLPIVQLLRSGEPEYRQYFAPVAKNTKPQEREIYHLLERYPKVLERPIVSDGENAVIGRPPEQVLRLIKS